MEAPATVRIFGWPGTPAASPQSIVRRGGLALWQAKRAHEYIERHIGSGVSVRELAHLVGLSDSHFSRAFKTSLGITPRGYIAQLRVEHAKHMITSLHKSLSQIAVDCGFADQPHLTKSFRRIVGVSPGVWRRMYAPGPAEDARVAASILASPIEGSFTTRESFDRLPR